MKKNWIFLIVLLLSFGLMSFATRTANNLKHLFSKLKIGLHGFKDIGLNGFSGLRLVVDVAILNPTGYDFSVKPNGKFQPKTIRAYYKNEQIAFASIPDITNLDLSSGKTAVIRDVVFNISYLGVASSIKDIVVELQHDKQKIWERLAPQIKFECDVNLMGSIEVISQSL